VTIEDPVEYQLSGLYQMHVNRKAGLTFPNGVRFIMRCDPDIVMVGETRDLETAELTMQAALTGHLVMTTLLPLDAVGVITRYLEMGLVPFIVASALSTVVSQRLVRKLCPSCKEEYTPPRDLLRQAGMKSAEISSGAFFRAKGCPACRQTGYKGRTAVFEVLEMNEKLRDLTSRRATTTELREAAAEAGMVTMLEDGLSKVREGLTSFDEVMRVLGTSAT
jgi:type II secretory ATPase GspE/PulE/Tfp pilus assembly ATPase PilB-like protein